jgi:hypothetical protein
MTGKRQSSSLSPVKPYRADHRFMKRLLGVIHGGKFDRRPEEFDVVGSVFEQAGGSWKRLFGGSTKDIDLLKRCLQMAAKKKLLTRSPNWEGKDEPSLPSTD